MSGGAPRLRLPVTPQNVAVARAFAVACARTLEASETTVEAVRLVVSDMATVLLQHEVAMMTIELETAQGAQELVVRFDHPAVTVPAEIRALAESTLAARAFIEAERWVIPIVIPSR